LTCIETNAVQCGICFEKSQQAFSLGCGHKFCVECFSQYLRVAVEDSTPLSVGLTHCPSPRCPQTVTDDIFRSFLFSRPASLAVYCKKLVGQFIESCPNMRCINN
jgi:hypothetical protein